jgi:hypothetical protein
MVSFCGCLPTFHVHNDFYAQMARKSCQIKDRKMKHKRLHPTMWPFFSYSPLKLAIALKTKYTLQLITLYKVLEKGRIDVVNGYSAFCNRFHFKKTYKSP